MYVAHPKQSSTTPSDDEGVVGIPDPMAPDAWDDVPIVVTRRRLARLALVSSETTARFQREGIEYDPMAWMFSPLAIFAGRDAIDAALDLDCCSRAILLHGLGMALDADPACIDALLHDDEPDEPFFCRGVV